MNKADMTREELQDELAGDLAVLEAHHEALAKAIDSLATIKRGGDVTFDAIGNAKAVADTYAEARGAMVHARGALKKRACARMAED